MPHYPCRHPTCSEFVRVRRSYCPHHGGDRPAAAGRADRRTSDRSYDATERDRGAKSFYNSAAWKRARAEKVAAFGVCERCQARRIEHVHHVKPLAECDAVESLAQWNLRGLCQPCHNAEEWEERRRRKCN